MVESSQNEPRRRPENHHKEDGLEDRQGGFHPGNYQIGEGPGSRNQEEEIPKKTQKYEICGSADQNGDVHKGQVANNRGEKPDSVSMYNQAEGNEHLCPGNKQTKEIKCYPEVQDCIREDGREAKAVI